MPHTVVSLSVLLALGGVAEPLAPIEHAELNELRLDQVQLIGTHNSYKLEVDDGIDHVMLETGYREDERFGAEDLVYRLAYHHPPLEVQLDLGVRFLELDVHADPAGGLYAEPGGYIAMAEFGLQPNAPFDTQGVMRDPGFKVLHVPDWDFLSSCATLKICLRTIVDWSAANPGHLPIILRLEPKERTMPPLVGMDGPTVVPEFDEALWRALQREILEVVPRDQLFVPSAWDGAWPTIADLRGRFMLVLGGGRSVAERYAAAAGEDRLIYTFYEQRLVGEHGASLARLSGRVDPATYEAPSGALVFAYTETVNTHEARENDVSRRDALFASDANVLFTGYAIPDPRFSPYRVRFENGTYARPHPKRAQE